jgi:hypothetical protein
MEQIEAPAEVGAELGVERLGPGVAVHHDAAVVAVDGLGRQHEIERLAEALLEERQADGLAGGARVRPDAAAVDERGGLLPEEGPRPGRGGTSRTPRRRGAPAAGRCAAWPAPDRSRRAAPARPAGTEVRRGLVLFDQVPAEGGREDHEGFRGFGAHGTSSRMRRVKGRVSPLSSAHGEHVPLLAGARRRGGRFRSSRSRPASRGGRRGRIVGAEALGGVEGGEKQRGVAVARGQAVRRARRRRWRTPWPWPAGRTRPSEASTSMSVKPLRGLGWLMRSFVGRAKLWHGRRGGAIPF